MAHSLAEFLAAANANTIRANNQYEIVATSGYSDVDNVLKTAVMFCKNFNIPGRSIDYATVSYKGYEMQNLVPTRISMEQEHTFDIIADVNGSYRRAFLAWMNHVINADIAGGSVFEGDRGINEQSIIRVQLFDKDNQTVIETVKLYNVRITQVGPIALTYESGDTATFQVTAKSTYWELESSLKGEIIGQK